MNSFRPARRIPAVPLLLLVTCGALAAPGPIPAGWPVESNEIGAAYGSAVATAGDVNGDGYADLIVGAPLHDNEDVDEGAAYLYLGTATGLATTPAWTAEGNLAGALFGSSVATAGDVNGDGFADVIIGASGHTNGEMAEGRAYVFLGGPTGLALTAAWTVESDNATAQLGAAVGPAGDVNGDGYSDVIVGAWNFRDPVNLETEGRAFVYLGSSTGLATTPAWTGEGNADLARFGWAVGTAGDVNGDGYSDVVVGAPNASNGEALEGRAFVYLGSAAGLSASAAWTTESNQIGAAYGFSVATAGDLNADGYSDVAVGAPLYDNLPDGNGGRVFIYFGSGAGLDTVPDDERFEINPAAHFGFSVSTAGDANGDGCGDLLVGADNYGGGVTTAGGAYLFRGRCQGGRAADFEWLASGNQQLSRFGAAVAVAGDVNGDGYADIVVGAPAYDNGENDEGRVYVYLGEPQGQPPGFPPNNIWLSEGDQADGQWAAAVSSAGDVNGDGYADLIVGAPLYDKGQIDEGAVFVYLGGESGLGSDATPGTPADWFIESNQAGAQLGSAVATAGDVNGDGYGDVIVGASGYSNGQAAEGRALLYLGGPTGLQAIASWSVESNEAGANLGASVGTAGDVNGDGYSDVIVGAPNFDNGQLDEGRAFVYLGSAGGLASTPAWTAESNEPGAGFGRSVASAGDVNRDGYSDVIVGAPNFDNDQAGEGRAYVYLGSATGLTTTAGWTAEGNQDDATFGFSVATAGDVNGDGYSDVIVGAPGFDNVGTNSGDAAVYLGGAAGLATVAAWNLQGAPQDANQEIGYAVSSAGDVNGDGYSDIIIGFPGKPLPGVGGDPNSGGAAVYLGSPTGPGLLSGGSDGSSGTRVGAAVAGAGDLNGDGLADYVIGIPRGKVYQSAPAGVAFVNYRNAGTFGVGAPVRQRRAGDTAPLAPLGASGSPVGVNLQVVGRSPFGRGKVRLQYEIKPLAALLDGTGLVVTPVWTDSGLLGAPLAAAINNLSAGTGYHWRLRVRYGTATSPFQAHGPWLTLAANGVQELDFRTDSGGAVDTDGDGVSDSLDNCTLVANPSQLDADGDGYGNICDADLNNSGLVTTADYALLRSVLNQPATASATAAAADLNGSGLVTTADYALLRSALNGPPGPSGLRP